MKRNLVIALVTTATLAVGGTAAAYGISAGDGATDAPSKQHAATSVEIDEPEDGDEDSDEAGAGSAKVTAQEALRAALAQAPGKVVSVELDDTDDDSARGARWEVEVLADDDVFHEVRIDPATGKVVESRIDRDDDKGDQAEDVRETRAALKAVGTGAEEAVKKASQGSQGAFVTSVELEDGDDDGDDDSARGASWDVEVAAAKTAK